MNENNDTGGSARSLGATRQARPANVAMSANAPRADVSERNPGAVASSHLPNSASRASRLLAGATFASGLGAILAALAVLPPSWLFALKPLTTLLVIAHAWPRGADAPRQRRWVRLGLILSLAGDVALLWPQEGFLPGLVAFLLAHLAYIAAFCVPLRLAARPGMFAVYGAVAVAILGPLWPGIPAPLRAPVVAYVVCLATMAAQAAGWWRRSRAHGAPDASLARRAALGGLLFMLSDSLLATNRFALPLPLASLWILASYWAAQWCIASALRAPTSP